MKNGKNLIKRGTNFDIIISMKQLLINLNACNDAKKWAADKTWNEIYYTCERGDWLLWLFIRTNPNDLQTLSLAKGHCAKTIKHLVRDERSLNAIYGAIDFGEGRITLEELKVIGAAAANSEDQTYVARTCYTAAVLTQSYPDAYSANTVDTIVATASYAAAALYYSSDYTAADGLAADGLAAKKKNQQTTADICRKYLPIEKWNINLVN